MSTARIHERVLLEVLPPPEAGLRAPRDVSTFELSREESSLSPASLEDLGELYRMYAHFVARFMTSIGAPRADIEDLVQEVFLVAHRRGGFREQGAKPTTWLAAIAWRVVGTHRRGIRRREEVVNTTEASEEHREAIADSAPDAYARRAATETLSDVQRALATLDPEHAAIFVLFEIEEQSCPDIAETFGLPLGTVHSRLHYARKAFNESFAKISRTRAKAGDLPSKGARQP